MLGTPEIEEYHEAKENQEQEISKVGSWSWLFDLSRGADVCESPPDESGR